ncbi:coiled-coil domain-containing protein 102A [Plodia interpunctella]|uniref:coiled-coil domain-containing protein 102A n=1 Tax=Plodia interpunctella TaxID=58824 RepID=UPI0023681C16|nr:coiled-coil domain-containing protein 102A [Plodia interpunctella]XP_053618415.1 coiled-coil domain-containing protein 102A [Plodia interpunctella]XP_053618416.1 coiled-coil domain-containing protein 102A [Plodia interpunctella]
MAQSSHGGSHRRSRDHEGAMRYTNTDWEAKEALYQRELDEARARATQMEKTMRWWSDCTANWREKWSKVRTERNKAREEAKQLKNKVDILTKELATLKSEKNDIDQQLTEVKRDNEKLLSIGESRIVAGELTAEDGIELRRKTGYISPNEPTARQRASLDSHKFSNVDNVLANKLSELRLRLDETCKSLQTEKDQKAFLLAKIETLSMELHSLKTEQHGDRTLGSTESSHSEVERLQNELQDEIAAKQVLEEKIAELKMEIERLKSENTVQWSKRELLETENIAILRENKKLYGQVCELREQIHKLNRISDGSAYGIPFTNDHAKLDSNVLYVRSSTSPRSHESSNSSEMNLAIDAKTNTSGEDDELAIVEVN